MMLTKFVRPHQNRRIRKKWLAVWLLLGTAVLLWVVVQANAQETIPYQVYLARISRYRTQIQNAPSCEVYGQIADELEAVTAVQMPDGSIMPVEHAGADRALRSGCYPEIADSYLAGLCPTNLCQPGPAQLTQPAEPSEPPSLDNFTQNINDPGDLPPIDPNTGRASPPTSSEDQSPQLAGETNNATGANGDTQPAPANNGDAAGEQPGADNAGTNSGEGVAENEGEGAPGAEAAAENGGESAASEEGSAGDSAADGAPADGIETSGEQPGGENPSDAAGETSAGGESGNADTTGTEGTTGETPGGEDSAAPAPAENAEDQAAAANDPSAPELAPETAVSTSIPRRTLIMISMIAVVLILLFTLIILIIRWRKQKEEEADKKPHRPQPSPAVKKQLDEGRKKVQQGEYREAVRKLFLAALITLNEQGAIRYDTTLTNMEILREAVLRPSLIQPLTPVINTYERVWYGYETLQTPEYESLVAQIHQLRERVRDEGQGMRDED